MSAVSKTVFVGDSLTEGGRWQEWFPELEAVNLGVGGDTTEGLIERLDEVAAEQPDTVVLLIGTNDVANRRAVEHVVRNIETILVTLRNELPDARILLQSVLPRGREYAEFVKEINRHVWQFAATVRAHYLDLWPVMAEPDGELNPAYTEDRLHLNDAGYEAWLSELRPAIERVQDLPPASRPIRLPDLSELGNA
ncbi:SGNH/GDSL hydrolase family protein [Herbiconiux sp. CPCC 203407]|jgi:lysophospholipase L1-like esterase|uniref:SGNH/GDSL hydrolase family protein n=1 Tax=Herbiconiux oxytropis TaxID=2970915 RepID=A0AA41XHW7_9MICO|nr:MULTISPECIES: SGNH/GDSL hydrolase family protein [Herbiconiux]MCS5720572.1 SGNH/GDSL hydrolase family protein [Herbiconiux oxytropis]MCS5726145.1 SGNH/GDSL hydrolase family protein [Herbiconiux oxytropis]